jgi:predicted acetyltransferase
MAGRQVIVKAGAYGTKILNIDMKILLLQFFIREIDRRIWKRLYGRQLEKHASVLLSTNRYAKNISKRLNNTQPLKSYKNDFIPLFMW